VIKSELIDVAPRGIRNRQPPEMGANAEVKSKAELVVTDVAFRDDRASNQQVRRKATFRAARFGRAAGGDDSALRRTYLPASVIVHANEVQCVIRCALRLVERTHAGPCSHSDRHTRLVLGSRRNGTDD
jgi:hypothetical protein